MVYGVIERTGVAAGTVLGVTAAWLAGAIPDVGDDATVGAFGLGVVADSVPFLAELSRRGVEGRGVRGSGRGVTPRGGRLARGTIPVWQDHRGVVVEGAGASGRNRSTRRPGGQAVSRRLISTAVLAAALVVAAGCGSGSSDSSVRSDTHGAHAGVAAADGTVDAAGVRTVTYQGVEFQVPGDWPVYDLSADPSTCVRFDVHAVYLGTPGPDMQCPAGLVGRADAILVQPADGSDATASAAASPNSASASSETVNGLSTEVVAGDSATSQIEARFPSAGVSTTITYGDSDATAQQILASFRAAAQ